MNGYNWQNEARCKDTGHNGWYPEDDIEANLDCATLVRICAACPVQTYCLDHAVRHEEFGFWGGKTAKAIRDIRRAKKIPLQVI
jgi:WhiB family redox-sensing transcriptional regulator